MNRCKEIYIYRYRYVYYYILNTHTVKWWMLAAGVVYDYVWLRRIHALLTPVTTSVLSEKMIFYYHYHAIIYVMQEQLV